MVRIAIGGLCMCCGKFSPGLYTCRACGARVCLACVATNGFCRLCGGIRSGGARKGSIRRV